MRCSTPELDNWAYDSSEDLAFVIRRAIQLHEEHPVAHSRAMAENAAGGWARMAPGRAVMAGVHIKVLAQQSFGPAMRSSPATNVVVPKGTSVSGVVALIVAAAKGRKIDRLSLLAHGYAEHWDGGQNRFADFTDIRSRYR